MAGSELCFPSAGQLSQLIRTRQLSPVEPVETQPARIETLEPVLTSFITLLPEYNVAPRACHRRGPPGRKRDPGRQLPSGISGGLHYSDVFRRPMSGEVDRKWWLFGSS